MEALKEFLDDNRTTNLDYLPKDAIADIQSVLKIEQDGIAGKQTKASFVQWKVRQHFPGDLVIGAGTARHLLDVANDPHPVSEQEKETSLELDPNAGQRSGREFVVGGEVFYANQLILDGGNLTWGEMTKGGFRVPVSKEIVRNIITFAQEFQEVRDKFDAPIAITSGYRPPAVNRAIGGARFSTHIRGLAGDLKAANLQKLWVVVNAIAKTGGVGDGRDRGFVHRDRRSTPLVRWNY